MEEENGLATPEFLDFVLQNPQRSSNKHFDDNFDYFFATTLPGMETCLYRAVLIN
jgi:hypothetical protein